MSAALAEALPNPDGPYNHFGRKVLILDDCTFDRLRMRRLIEEAGLSFDVVEAETLDAMEAALRAQDFDLVLIDFYLTGATGFEALEILQSFGGKMPVPIMITGDEQTEIAVQAMKRGCVDYLPKSGLSPSRLKEAIQEAHLGLAENPCQTRPKLNQTLKLVSSTSATVRPQLAGMVRELRALKADLSDQTGRQPARREDAERRYGERWGKLWNADTDREGPHQ